MWPDEDHFHWGTQVLCYVHWKIWIYPIKVKSECFDKFKEFKALVENQCKKKIKVLPSDNGGEFMSNEFGEFLKKQGIARQTSTPYTPQQNEVAER